MLLYVKSNIYKNTSGWHNCKLNKIDCNCKKLTMPVEITFKENEKADNWGNMVTVFRKSETVQGYAVVKDGVGYCASASSNIYDGYEDFINTNNAYIKLL